ncbi:hypothetical protein KC330_g7467 [Hortaea werneckii]|nr:hypothetical protein KC330_g7467 [Hortaea werneckii]
MALTTNTDSPEAYILRLPVEILEVAASYTQLENIMSLRLACKELNHQLIRAYERDRYSKLTFYLANRYSMQALEDLSKHPVLGKHMKTIQLAEGRLATVPDTRSINIKTNVPDAPVNIVALSAEDAKAFSVVGRIRTERLVGYTNCSAGESDIASQKARTAHIVSAIMDGACPLSVLHLGTTESPVIDSTLKGLKDHSEFATTLGSLTELHLYLRLNVDGSELATMLAKISALRKLYLGSK